MTGKIALSRRQIVTGLGAGAGGLLLSGCDALNSNPGFRSILHGAEKLTYNSQRLLVDRAALAREYGRSEMSPVFRANGSTMPQSEAYQAHAANGFADWRLVVDGLVARPLAIGLPQLMALPARTQITRHDCVEGWSAIGEWHGPQLRTILQQAGVSSSARYIAFHCADAIGGVPYYESVDMIDAMHPQTILAWRMNGDPLPVAHGAPIRLRVERQLGYKHAKYVMRIEARDRLDNLNGGKGGYWEDRIDYEWYAGI